MPTFSISFLHPVKTGLNREDLLVGDIALLAMAPGLLTMDSRSAMVASEATLLLGFMALQWLLYRLAGLVERLWVVGGFVLVCSMLWVVGVVLQFYLMHPDIQN